MTVPRNPTIKRRPIDKVFGVPPAALSGPRRRASTTLPRAPRMGWPDLDEILAPRPTRPPRRAGTGRPRSS
jgi:hypothetical protein